MISIDKTIEQILHSLKFKPEKQFHGNSGAIVLLCESQEIGNVIIKIATNERSVEEIKANIKGYEKIKKEGLEKILPDTLFYSLEGKGNIIMSYLGDNFELMIKKSKDPIKQYYILCSLMENIYRSTVKNDKNSEKFLSLLENDLLTRYKKYLIPVGFLSKNIEKEVKNVNITSMAPEKSCFACFDFTPEDVFINQGQFKFPDPKSQIRGVPIIDLACFSGVAKDVYFLPGSEEGYRIIKQFALTTVSKILDLSYSSAEKIFNYERALQLAISAKVRMDVYPETSKKLSELSLYYLRRCDSIT